MSNNGITKHGNYVWDNTSNKWVKQIEFGSLVPGEYDYIAITYTGSNITQVVYKTGGSGGTTVATLDLTYDGSNNILTVTRT